MKSGTRSRRVQDQSQIWSYILSLLLPSLIEQFKSSPTTRKVGNQSILMNRSALFVQADTVLPFVLFSSPKPWGRRNKLYGRKDFALIAWEQTTNRKNVQVPTVVSESIATDLITLFCMKIVKATHIVTAQPTAKTLMFSHAPFEKRILSRRYPVQILFNFCLRFQEASTKWVFSLAERSSYKSCWFKSMVLVA